MFYKDERAYLNTGYFRWLHETDRLIEVESKNTRHRWTIIKPHVADANYSVILYHNHNTSTSSYHKHAVAKTVRQAVTIIKKHDDYVLRKG